MDKRVTGQWSEPAGPFPYRVTGARRRDKTLMGGPQDSADSRPHPGRRSQHAGGNSATPARTPPPATGLDCTGPRASRGVRARRSRLRPAGRPEEGPSSHPVPAELESDLDAHVVVPKTTGIGPATAQSQHGPPRVRPLGPGSDAEHQPRGKKERKSGGGLYRMGRARSPRRWKSILRQRNLDVGEPTHRRGEYGQAYVGRKEQGGSGSGGEVEQARQARGVRDALVQEWQPPVEIDEV